MSNTYFQFKQFRIEQDKCAMKVCTDSCLFGAWLTPEANVQTVLDIGTGTGLLSLMLAQKINGKIDAVEMDEAAVCQARDNIQASPWKDSIRLISGDVRAVKFSGKYDLIVCNPPFYENELKSQLHGEKIAKHSLHLSLEELFSIAGSWLAEQGEFALLLPWYRKKEAEGLAAAFHLYPKKTLAVRQTVRHGFFRYAAVFAFHNSVVQTDEISIKDEWNEYSAKALDLLRPYYLYL